MTRKKHIAVDLDGTLAKHNPRNNPNEWMGVLPIGDPIEETMDLVIDFYEQGHTLILQTVRLNPNMYEDIKESGAAAVE